MDESATPEASLVGEANDLAEVMPRHDWSGMLDEEAGVEDMSPLADLDFMQAKAEHVNQGYEQIIVVENDESPALEGDLFSLVATELFGEQSNSPSLLFDQAIQPEQSPQDKLTELSEKVDEEILHEHIQTLSDVERASAIEIFEDIVLLTTEPERGEKTTERHIELRKKWKFCVGNYLMSLGLNFKKK